MNQLYFDILPSNNWKRMSIPSITQNRHTYLWVFKKSYRKSIPEMMFLL